MLRFGKVSESEKPSGFWETLNSTILLETVIFIVNC